MPSTQASHTKKLLLGCIYMLCAVFCFSVGNALVKQVSEETSVMQILFFRGVLSVCMLYIYFVFFNKKDWIKTSNMKMQVGRGIIAFFSLYAMFLSFKLLPLTDAVALSFATPLFISVLAIPLLKEKLNFRQWIAIVVGFIGVSLLADPTGNVTIAGSAAALISALLEGIVMILSRVLSKQDHPLTSVFYHACVISVCATFFIPFYWSAVSLNLFLLLFLLAFISNLGQVFVVFAYSKAPAAVIAPILYTLIIWSALLGYILWGEHLTPHLLWGLPIVILSGLYIVYEEFKTHRP